MTRIFNSTGPPDAQGRSSLSRGPDEPGHRTGLVQGRGTPTGHRRGCHPRTGTKPVKRHRTLQSNKKEARGWATFAPTGTQSGAYRTKGGKRSKYSRSVKYQVKLAKYQVKLGQGQKERDSGAKGAQIR